MPALFVFLLKVNIALLLFCAGYYLVLRHLTFYTLNRVYLLAAILCSTLYPKLNLLAFAQRHEQLVKPVAINWQLIMQPVSLPAYWQWLTIIFWTGAVLLTIRLTFQLLSLFKLYKNSSPALINNHWVRVMSKDTAPFSFWKSIYVNPDKHEAADLQAILLHEQVHVNQWHTADILLAELSTIFYWFNPGIWLIKKAVRENIEFITDQKILNKGIDSKMYQYSLVNVSFNNSTHSIVNHFNISTIKKRIIMMNAKRSSRFNLTRYALVLPVVFALLLVFSVSKADFAKPIRIKLANTIKPLAKYYISIGVSPKPAKVNKYAVKASQIMIDPIKKKSDTTVAKFFKVLQSDSVVFYLNGIRSDVKNIDTKNIASVVVLKGDDAATYLNNTNNNKASVILLTTKDSPEGKIIMERVKKSVSNSNLTTTTNGVTNNQNIDFTSTIARTNSNPSSTSTTNTYSLSAADNSITSNTISIGDKTAKPARFSIGVGESTKVDKNNPNNKIVVLTSTSSKTNADGTPKVVPGSIVVTADKAFDIKTSDGKTPLVLVDGKEITQEEIKKIDPAHINSINVIKDDTATKKYGDKARDGVIEITTSH